ncbi:hypothetical protein PoB_006937200 [Plakobranchus ocellatus]|uniref:Uncharacterized protein n=1 Tax=Plakobranchus ocellatus TaxID=259542 RepID=A0AAV4DF31_9GAST|nr:hypothetical protein PoB_006937200 [Plakobranchus ocellatus]
MDFAGEEVGSEGEGGGPWGFSAGGRGWDLEGEGGHSIGEAETLGELGVEESPQIEDIVSSASIARGAKRLTVSLGASCLFYFSALRLAGTSVSAALWGLRAGKSFWALFLLGVAEGALLPPSLLASIKAGS